jgi:hypothetical protein
MNDFIDTVFGDRFISLTCNGGECLHVSQVPGYKVCRNIQHSACVMTL